MFRWILIAVLAIGIAGTAFWGYQEHQEKNAILIQAENTYQRAFHELTYHVDLLNDKIGSALAMNSDQRLSPQLVEIWRITSEALSDVGQLPLGLLPFNKTEEFLSEIGDFTYRTAVRNLETDPLSDKETKSLESLYKQSGEIKDELRQVQHVALKNNLRWMDVQLAMANEDEQMDNTIIDGFKTVEKTVEGFSEGNGDASISNTSVKKHEYKFLTGEEISEDEALAKAKSLFNVKNNEKINITKSGKGADVPVYSISYRNDKKNAYMDLSQKGGHPITLLVDRPVNDKQISLNQGMKKAQKYLEQFDFENMTVFQSTQFDNIGAFSFLYSEDGVRYYSDAMEVKVALDNGDILGLTANDYFMNHTEREKPTPELSEEEAKEMVNPNVDIQEEFLAVIDNDLGEEVLTYEFLGILGNETYRIFINAMDGKEERVEKLSGSEINYASSM
ncbi:MAG: germination protein YpeB [Bacillota bacterium]|uniref:Germination protein YpeB n=1 Tax=Virgibacillus salarius TaxID=447199 RepID=A0A941DUC9_9BACI|nr:MULTISPECIES: germination protein YpeB [Bacillaceae]MBR7795536.1 germination protein YpeB [Virgibacillus salarius]MCC2249038.1 germination protein YpeB [Virgibacillus sp. AGTR]NAZ08249.1 germination protein YpeB [Agaribacter marinus]QRZ16999.1 germination protein YpeB [Virgibacillus sp. AGTR]